MGGFTPLFDCVIQDVGIVGASVYGRVWRYSQGEYGVCQATTGKIAEELSLSGRTVIRWLGALCEAGYLEDTTPGLRNKPHTYRDKGKVKIQARLDAVTESHTGDSAMTESHTAMTESHSHYDRESYEETSKRQEKREEPGVFPETPEQDADELFRGSSSPTSTTQEQQPTESILANTDPGSMAAACAAKKRNGWGPALDAFCRMHDLSAVPRGCDKKWARAMREIATPWETTPEVLAMAIEAIPKDPLHHWRTFKTPCEPGFADLMAQMISKVIDGKAGDDGPVVRFTN
jgi:hypothetical protein